MKTSIFSGSLCSALLWIGTSLFALSTGHTISNPSWTLDSQHLSQQEQQLLKVEIGKQWAKIPPVLRQRLRNIQINFQVDPGLGASKNYDLKQICSAKSTVDPSIFAETKKPRFFSKNKFVIALSMATKNEILGGMDASRNYPCGHANTYRKAQAVLTHQIALIYDLSNYRTAQERSWQDKCRRSPRSKQKRSFSPLCSHYSKLKTTVSSLSQFKTIAGVVQTGFLSKRRRPGNLKTTSTPLSPLKTEDLPTSFALHMEYFVSDSQYQCRAHSMYQYLAQHFSHAPYSGVECAAPQFITSAPNTDREQKISIDPKRVYDIHYLHADKGESLASRWGHSMLRIVACAPHRKTLSEECLHDDDHHWVLSFSAAVPDLQLNPIRGIRGGYASRAHLISFNDVKTMYNKNEHRRLLSLPIPLNAQQKMSTLRDISAMTLDYLGQYFFFQNNCTTETLNLLKRVIPSLSFQVSRATTPVAFLKLLNKFQLVDLELLKNEELAVEKGYLYLKTLEVLEQSKIQLDSLGVWPNPWSSLTYIKDSSPLDRYQVFRQLRNEGQLSPSIARKLLKFENYIHHMKNYELEQSALKAFYEKHEELPHFNSELYQAFWNENDWKYIEEEAELRSTNANIEFLKSLL